MRPVKFLPALLCLFMLAAYPAAAEIKFGVNAPRGELDAMALWGEMGKYLTEKIGDTVTIVPLKVADLVGAVAQDQVDLVIANPIQGAVVNVKNGATPLLTLNNKSGSSFAGVIIAAKESGIKDVSGLKGKKIMALDKSSAGAYIFEVYHLVKKGFDPRQEAVMEVAKKQDDAPLAVKAGLADVAFVRTGILESMQKEGKLTIDEFVIIDKRDDPGFEFVHSTELYPEWMLLSAAKANAEATAKIKAALLALTPDSAVAKAAGIKGFVEPISLDGLKDALRVLKAPPFDN